MKENDLAHGQYIDWLNSIGMNRRQASRFIKVTDEFSNGTTSSHLGMNVLYEIATLPEKEKQAQIERVEQGESPTVKELREIKRQLKAKEEIIAGQESQLED